jgi:predicted DNA binding CopG/RHH family protein
MSTLQQVTARLSDDDIETLTFLASARGLTANEVLRQAIKTEKIISENIHKGDSLQIVKSNNTVLKFVLSK